MFEDSHNTDFDLLMKSILESGEEEVPERVWGGISEELDTRRPHCGGEGPP